MANLGTRLRPWVARTGLICVVTEVKAFAIAFTTALGPPSQDSVKPAGPHSGGSSRRACPAGLLLMSRDGMPGPQLHSGVADLSSGIYTWRLGVPQNAQVRLTLHS